MIPVKIAHVSFSEVMGFVVLLQSASDKKTLPILIGAPEAQAIAMALENIRPPRPLTHDLLKSVLDGIECRLKRVYEQMAEPKFVVAVGTCACSGGVFDGCYNVKKGINSVIPVSAYIPGCPASPKAIIDGVVKLLKSLEEKEAKE